MTNCNEAAPAGGRTNLVRTVLVGALLPIATTALALVNGEDGPWWAYALVGVICALVVWFMLWISSAVSRSSVRAACVSAPSFAGAVGITIFLGIVLSWLLPDLTGFPVAAILGGVLTGPTLAARSHRPEEKSDADAH